MREQEQEKVPKSSLHPLWGAEKGMKRSSHQLTPANPEASNSTGVIATIINVVPIYWGSEYSPDRGKIDIKFRWNGDSVFPRSSPWLVEVLLSRT